MKPEIYGITPLISLSVSDGGILVEVSIVQKCYGIWLQSELRGTKRLTNIISRVLYHPKHCLCSVENKKLNHIINFWMISISILCESIWKILHLGSGVFIPVRIHKI